MEVANVTVIKETEGKTSPLISHAAFFRRERKTLTEALCINQHGLTVTTNTSKILIAKMKVCLFFYHDHTLTHVDSGRRVLCSMQMLNIQGFFYLVAQYPPGP